MRPKNKIIFPKLLGQYKNGDVKVRIYEDGTKIRESEKEFPEVIFPESFDCKITDYCDLKCAYCHEKSTVKGKHGDLNIDLFDHLKPFTEIAIGGGNPLDHPQLEEFLLKLKNQNVIANITVNLKHIKKGYLPKVKYLVDEGLVKGVGVSIDQSNLPNTSLFRKIEHELGENVIYHIILGMYSAGEIVHYMSGRKVLILGYKDFGRGEQYLKDFKNDINFLIKDFKTSFKEVMNNVKICLFDNLALKQLDIKSLVSEDEWKLYYQGDDGSHTMYFDAVNQYAAKTSTSTNHFSYDNNSLEQLFNKIKLEEN